MDHFRTVSFPLVLEATKAFATFQLLVLLALEEVSQIITQETPFGTRRGLTLAHSKFEIYLTVVGIQEHQRH